MSETPQVAPANQDPTQLQGPLAESVQALLQDESISHLTEYEQGQIIVDHFVGELVGRGPIKGTQGEQDASQILGTVDMITREAKGSPQVFGAAMRTVSRTDGLRQAVFMLAGDRRTGEFFGQLSSRLRTEGGKPALRSLTQLDSYLNVKATPDAITDATSWRNVVRAEVAAYATDPTRKGRWDTNHLMGSEVAQVRDEQKLWEDALSAARSAEVDVDLLKRSAEEMRSLAARGQMIGNVSIAHAFDKTYDALFS